MLDQHFLFCAIPATRPVFIGPAQAEREINFGVLEQLIDWLFKKSFSIKPVMIETESFNTMLSCQLRLSSHHPHIGQVIITKLRRDARLIMPLKQGPTLANISPFCKTVSPPLIIFWNNMILRKIECDCTERRIQIINIICGQILFHRKVTKPRVQQPVIYAHEASQPIPSPTSDFLAAHFNNLCQPIPVEKPPIRNNTVS